MTNSKFNWKLSIFLPVAFILLSLVIEYGTDLKLFRFISDSVKLLGHGIWWFLLIRVPMWVFLPVLLFLSFIIYTLVKTLKEQQKSIPKPVKTISPKFLDYTSEVFNGVEYRWQWNWDSFNSRYTITDKFQTLCHKCQYTLIIKNGRQTCPNCEDFYFLMDDMELRSRIIHHIEENKLDKYNQQMD